MASTESTSSTARFDALHELLARAQEAGLSAQLSIHGVPMELHLDWLQAGLLDAIEQGASGNPPTGHMESGSYPEAKASAVTFTEDAGDRRRRIAREEDAAVAELAAELGQHGPEELAL